MPYSENSNLNTNVNYLNKDFASLKNTLINYAKAYFPDTHKDFNETSPGMMLIEMSAYVGDVLSYYIDQQYREMLLPLAKERRNVVNIAKMLGYTVKPTTPAFTDISITQTVGVIEEGNVRKPDYSNALIINKGVSLKGSTNTNVIFETLDIIDFSVSSSSDPTPKVNNTNDISQVTEYLLTRKVRAVSGETKTSSFTIGRPEKFLKLTLPETNVIEILSVYDNITSDINPSGNRYYEVDFLSQDKVPIETHYLDGDRATAYSTIATGADNIVGLATAAPYKLEYIDAPKRFTTEINDDNTISLVFGNGILRSKVDDRTDILDLDAAGVILPGDPAEVVPTALNPFLTSDKTTLGEAPSNVSLTISYRIGGGIDANVASGELIDYSGTEVLNPGAGTISSRNVSFTNVNSARGGTDGETIEEIRNNASAFFATQNRCVTEQDYTARVKNLPAKFGYIAKAYAQRSDTLFASDTGTAAALDYDDSGTLDSGDFTNLMTSINAILTDGSFESGAAGASIQTLLNPLEQLYGNYAGNSGKIPSIDIYVLGYNNSKQLVEFEANHPLLTTNLPNYLDQFRILTDEINIQNGKIIHFGVIFDVVSDRRANRAEVKINCINKIKNYFKIEKMTFKQPIYVGDLEYLLMDTEGVRSVNNVTITQKSDYRSTNNASSPVFTPPLYDTVYYDGAFASTTAAGVPGSTGYGYRYDFETVYAQSGQQNIILPSMTPAVFEIKNPNSDIKGIVR